MRQIYATLAAALALTDALAATTTDQHELFFSFYSFGSTYAFLGLSISNTCIRMSPSLSV